MNNLDFEIYRLWRPDFKLALIYAIQQKNNVLIATHGYIDKCNSADLSLYGRFVGFSGDLLQFVIEDFNADLSMNFPGDPECDYTFKARIPVVHQSSFLIEYNGRGLIIDRELQKNDIPESLLIRLSHPVRIRRLRMHERLSDTQNLFLMPGLLLMDQEPINRRRLLNLMAYYYKQKKRPKPEIVDISAGGACLKTHDIHCQRFMGAEESYLFFFFSEENGEILPPNVFLAKKAGILRGDDASHAGLRIRFMKELVWTAPNEDLKWINIEADGSSSIKKILSLSKDKNDEKENKNK